MKRCAATLPFVLGLLLGAPAAASALTVSTGSVNGVVAVDTGGVKDRITTGNSGTQAIVVDSAGVAAIAPCVAISPTSAGCPVSVQDSVNFSFEVGVGNDEVFLKGPSLTFGTTNVTGGPGKDVIIGGPLADRFLGGAGADDLDGGPGSDQVIGGLEDDLLRGGPGDDVLSGKAGDDHLAGGPGGGLLSGGHGRDVCVKASGKPKLIGCERVK
jgi:Ca2+-binding RTX toxin-like protein